MNPLLNILPVEIVHYIHLLATNRIWVIRTADGKLHYEPRPMPHRDIASMYNVRVRPIPRSIDYMDYPDVPGVDYVDY